MRRKSIRNILLIQPPYTIPEDRGTLTPNAPLGLAYIAAVLETAGYKVQILDAFVEGWETAESVGLGMIRVGLPLDEIRKTIETSCPDLVGITSMFTSQRHNAHRVAKLAKEIDSSTVVVMGGAHPTAAPEMVVKDYNVDFAVLGEGEDVIVQLLKKIESGDDPGDLQGIAYMDSGGKMVLNDRLTSIVHLDTIPFPARHLLPMEKYFSLPMRHGGLKKRSRPTNMITSRGCQFRCNFCTAFKVFGRRPRHRSVANIISEIDELVNTYGVNEIYFEDDQFLGKVGKTGDLLDAIISRQYDLVWDTPNGISPWLLNETVIAKMKIAGCYRVNLAVESGNQWVLDHLIKKPVKVTTIRKLVKLIKKHGMVSGMFLVIGNIGEDGVETKEQIRDSLHLIWETGVDDLHVSILVPYPGSRVLDIAREKGYFVPDFDWDDLVIHKGVLVTPEWTPQELIRLREDAKKPDIGFLLRHPVLMASAAWKIFYKNPRAFPRKGYRFLKHAMSS